MDTHSKQNYTSPLYFQWESIMFVKKLEFDIGIFEIISELPSRTIFYLPICNKTST